MKMWESKVVWSPHFHKNKLSTQAKPLAKHVCYHIPTAKLIYVILSYNINRRNKLTV